MSRRRSKCKCGRIIQWNEDSDGRELIVCKHCGAKFRIECDDILIYWLEEVDDNPPYVTGLV